MSKPEFFLWLDLETSGLDASYDAILEVAMILTGSDFKPIAEFESVIDLGDGRSSSLAARAIARMPKHVFEMHQSSGLMHEFMFADGRTKWQDIERALCGFLRDHGAIEDVILAGGSIHFGRRFIDARWPEFAGHLHHRMLDVTSLALAHQAHGGELYKKKKAHRAMPDILESIAEFKWLCEKFGLRT